MAVHLLYPVLYRLTSSLFRFRCSTLPSVIIAVQKYLPVDCCPTRCRQFSGLGSLGWAMRAFCSYYAPRISPIEVDEIGCKVRGPTVRMDIDSTVFLCVSLERERETERERDWERERERGERDKEKEKREKERKREREEERRGERTPQNLPCCFFTFFFCRLTTQKQITFPPSAWQRANVRIAAYMHAQRRLSWSHHRGRPSTAGRICGLPPLFLSWLVAYCTFSTLPCAIGKKVRPIQLTGSSGICNRHKKLLNHAGASYTWSLRHIRCCTVPGDTWKIVHQVAHQVDPMLLSFCRRLSQNFIVTLPVNLFRKGSQLYAL